MFATVVSVLMAAMEYERNNKSHLPMSVFSVMMGCDEGLIKGVIDVGIQHGFWSAPSDGKLALTIHGLQAGLGSIFTLWESAKQKQG